MQNIENQSIFLAATGIDPNSKIAKLASKTLSQSVRKSRKISLS